MDMGDVQRISYAFPGVPSSVHFKDGTRYIVLYIIIKLSKYYIEKKTNHISIDNFLRSLWYRVK